MLFCGAMKSNFVLSVAVALSALAWSSVAFCGEIHDAVDKGEVEMVKALIEKNLEFVNSKGKSDWMPLHYAAYNGSKEIAELLLTHKAEVDAKNEDSRTPLHVAALNGHMEVVKLFLSYK